MKGWRTTAWNGIKATLAIILVTDLTGLGFEPQTAGWILLGVTIADQWLRMITTTPVGKDF